jgi:hypothetical protein
MPLLHNPAVREAIDARLGRLRADSRPAWGKMSVDQMLWHVSQAMAADLGHITAPREMSWLPRPLMKFLVLNMRWPKGAPTSATFRAVATHDFDEQLARCRWLINELTSRPLDRLASRHPTLGRMSGRDISRLHAKHLDHHLRQFGV